jgi:hypothetical protein
MENNKSVKNNEFVKQLPPVAVALATERFDLLERFRAKWMRFA